MKRFLELHLLTSYPPSNLNRDDIGRPKTAMMGGAQRLRVSSQSLKRAWRTSDLFEEALAGHLGKRTRNIGFMIRDQAIKEGAEEALADGIARTIVEYCFRKGKNEEKAKKPDLELEQMVHVSPEEQAAIEELAVRAAREKRDPEPEECLLLQEKTRAADIALFGRMLAKKTDFSVDASVQVAHAVTVHECAIEDDFFSAVEDLNQWSSDAGAGAGHLGETEFGAGLYYLYVCVNRELLQTHLSDDSELTARALRALVEAAATVAPSGKQNSFGSRAYASYVLAELGDFQPRSLSVAFLDPVQRNYLSKSIEALKATRDRIEQAYHPGAAEDRPTCELDAVSGRGSLPKLLDFVTQGLDGAG